MVPGSDVAAEGGLTSWQYIVVYMVIAWVVSAIALFFRKRLAWCVSVLCVSFLVYQFGSLLFYIIAYCFTPPENWAELRSIGRMGHVFAVAFLFTEFSLLLAVAIRLLVGLWQMRRDLFAPACAA